MATLRNRSNNEPDLVEETEWMSDESGLHFECSQRNMLRMSGLGMQLKDM